MPSSWRTSCAIRQAPRLGNLARQVPSLREEPQTTSTRERVPLLAPLGLISLSRVARHSTEGRSPDRGIGRPSPFAATCGPSRGRPAMASGRAIASDSFSYPGSKKLTRKRRPNSSRAIGKGGAWPLRRASGHPAVGVRSIRRPRSFRPEPFLRPRRPSGGGDLRLACGMRGSDASDALGCLGRVDPRTVRPAPSKAARSSSRVRKPGARRSERSSQPSPPGEVRRQAARTRAACGCRDRRCRARARAGPQGPTAGCTPPAERAVGEQVGLSVFASRPPLDVFAGAARARGSVSVAITLWIRGERAGRRARRCRCPRRRRRTTVRRRRARAPWHQIRTAAHRANTP